VRPLARGALALLLVLPGSPGVRAQSAQEVAALIPAALPGAQRSLSRSALSHGASAALVQVYAVGGNAPLWVLSGAPSAAAQALIAQLEDAERFGLRASDYPGAALRQALRELPAPGGAGRVAALAQWDAQLSAAALHFICDLHFGRIAPEAAGFRLEQAPAPFDLVQALRGVAHSVDAEGALAAVEPVFYHYKLLKDALARYRKIAPQLSAISRLPPLTASVKRGEPYAGAEPLRRRLEILGDLSAPAAGDPGVYDAELSAAVARFQDRHGLAADGVLGRGTLTALNTPGAQRIRQISLTLERWRWLVPFNTPPIIVNIPQFQLFAFRTTEDRVADILQMHVIVGRAFADTQTPVFEGAMRYVVLRPYWDVPYSITQKEMLPKIHANPAYLAREHLQLVDGPGDNSPVVPASSANLTRLAQGKLRLRQEPGEDNALGLAKFMFPNSYNVYLHSTPAHQLFKDPVRAFSHGCIRVADPLALATLVLKNAAGKWTREKIEAAMNGGSTLRVNLDQPIDVLILYGTALATEGGPVLFFPDLYGYDRKLEQQLHLPPAR
jgi:murein L,D-transpeptidase YcbB/YkuD